MSGGLLHGLANAIGMASGSGNAAANNNPNISNQLQGITPGHLQSGFGAQQAQSGYAQAQPTMEDHLQRSARKLDDSAKRVEQKRKVFEYFHAQFNINPFSSEDKATQALFHDCLLAAVQKLESL